MNDQDYDNAVRRIPHLNLTEFVPKVPLVEILEEYEKEKFNISCFEYGVDTEKNPNLVNVVEYLKNNWKGFGVIDITDRGDHMIDYHKEAVNHDEVKALGIVFDENGFGVYRPTDVGRRMTKTLEYIYSLFKVTGRVRFSMLCSGGVIGYHNHEVKSLVDRKRLVKPLIAEGSNRSAIHVPIIENPKSFHLVTKGWSRDYTDSDRFQLPENAVEYVQHYATNEVWMFNAVHYHKAVNLGNTDRVHLLCYFDHMDEKIRPYIESAIENYHGPWID
jgi:hypothetical protein